MGINISNTTPPQSKNSENQGSDEESSSKIYPIEKKKHLSSPSLKQTATTDHVGLQRISSLSTAPNTTPPLHSGQQVNTSRPSLLKPKSKKFVSPIKPPVSQTTTTRTSISTDNTQESLLDLGKEATSSPLKLDRSTPPSYPVPKGSKRNTSFPQHEHKQFISPVKPHVSQTTTTRTSISTDKTQESLLDLGKEAISSPPKVDRSTPPPYPVLKGSKRNTSFLQHEHKQFISPLKPHVSQTTTTHTSISTNTAQERSTQLGKEAAPSKLKPPLPTSMQDQCQKSPPFTKHQSKQFKPPIHSSISQKNTTATHIYSPQDETEEKTLKLESTTGKGENPPLLSLSKAYNKRLLHPSNLEESKKQAPFIKPNQAHNISSVTSSFSQTTAAQPTDHPLTTLAIPQEHLKEERQPSLIPFKEVVARLEKLLSLSIDTELSQNEVAIFIFESLQNYIENSILTEQFIHEAYACLFHSELALHAQEFLNENRSFIKPHPAYVIFSLADCFKALSQEDNFLTIITKAKNYFKSKVEDLLIAHQNQPSVSDYLKKETNAVFIKSVNECPLYTATQWFGTENLNPVFILRTQNFQPEWVFKPTTLDEKSNLSDIRDCEHYAFKMNFHEKFPIPAVFLIQFRGVSGTIQPFIPDTVQFKDIPKDKRILILPALRKLLIFDLLFINHD
ncbi:MAG: hypothetical protein QRY72_03700 [Candidatus Rhabdochlamydia sp.]